MDRVSTIANDVPQRIAPSAPVASSTVADTTSSGLTPNLLSLGVWNISFAWCAVMGLLVALIGWGLYNFSLQEHHGDVVTGLRAISSGGAAWGLYIIFDIYLVGISFSGVFVLAMVRLRGSDMLRPISRIAQLVSIVALMGGALCVLCDLGRPDKGLINFPQFARISSPFFGTFSLVDGAYLTASITYFLLSGRPDAAYCAKHAKHFRWVYKLWASGFKGTAVEWRRHDRTSFWLALFLFPLLMIAHSTLGFIFGIQGGRPGWFSPLQAPAFLLMAATSGTGILVVVAALIRRVYRLEHVITAEALRWLGNLLFPLTIGCLYLMVSDELTSAYAAPAAQARIAREIVFGAYAPLFWSMAAALSVAALILLVLFVRRSPSIGWTMLAGILVNIATVLKRYILVVPSQTHGKMLPYSTGYYAPTLVEISIVLGIIALIIMLFVFFFKIFPIVELQTSVGAIEVPPESDRVRIARVVLFWLVLLLGLGMAIVGFLASSQAGVDASIPYAPVIFITGLVTCFFSAALYETLPFPWPLKETINDVVESI